MAAGKTKAASGSRASSAGSQPSRPPAGERCHGRGPVGAAHKHVTSIAPEEITHDALVARGAV
eukprot:1136565-Lingulodinium_polyedra.AAC.1